ncbi:MAG: 50S ribosomal protein L17 [Saprospiraceae bacterium]
MRHGDKINNLGRTVAHRRALLANLAIALIEHKRITTTLAKAKALRRYVEPLVTKAKANTTHSRRVVFSYLQNKEAVHELFSNVAAKIGERPGGYVRVIKLAFRRGDGAETAMIEFVDFNEVYNPNAGKVKVTKKTRRGSSGAKKTTTPAAVETEDAIQEEETLVAAEPEAMSLPVETIEAEPVVAAAEAAVAEEVVAEPEPEAPVAEPEAEMPVASAEESAAPDKEAAPEEQKDDDTAA